METLQRDDGTKHLFLVDGAIGTSIFENGRLHEIPFFTAIIGCFGKVTAAQQRGTLQLGGLNVT